MLDYFNINLRPERVYYEGKEVQLNCWYNNQPAWTRYIQQQFKYNNAEVPADSEISPSVAIRALELAQVSRLDGQELIETISGSVTVSRTFSVYTDKLVVVNCFQRLMRVRYTGKKE